MMWNVAVIVHDSNSHNIYSLLTHRYEPNVPVTLKFPLELTKLKPFFSTSNNLVFPTFFNINIICFLSNRITVTGFYNIRNNIHIRVNTITEKIYSLKL